MLAEPKLKSFTSLVKESSREELIWMSGYLSALAGFSVPESFQQAAIQPAAPAFTECTVLYGTETGNSKKLATDFSAKLKKTGVQVKLKSLDQYRSNDILKEKNLLLVISTHGDGEPPAAARKFCEYIHNQYPDLSHIKYGVLALGDSSYPLFCKAGEDADACLTKLGAKRLIAIGKCDTDYEAEANAWFNNFISAASSASGAVVENTIVKTQPAKTTKKIYEGVIAANINLNDKGSAKKTYHVEIVTEDDVQYEPGDALGLIPRNSESAVDKVLQLLAANGNEKVAYKEQQYELKNLLIEKINLHHLPERIVQQYAKLVNKEIPAIRIDLADLLRIYPSENKIEPQQLINILEPIAPRLYSIASSPAAHGNTELHLTVALNKFSVDGHERFGLCSDYLAQLNEGDIIEFYIQKNNAFKLPDADADIIMVGPGTGIAPFRSFLLERDALGAAGRNWLVFGEQHFVSDFLYQTDLLALFETGVLTKLNTAFSRDQQEKIYVQHKLHQHAAEVFNWLQSGAHFYICGAKNMSDDVEQTLLSIISEQGNFDAASATEYFESLKENGRFHKDVY
ncbi:MAG TPA: flavodoxin domain-containing protein [Chitinophagaceae bacterium]|nr:flavodoxin domain-containing protein [Chitinophagaceae bacterium]